MAIDLKVGAFEPEYVGKMGFYLNALDDLVRTPQDGPSIGIILCRDRDEVVVEYALGAMARPIGVSAFEIAPGLPEVLRESLPSADQLAAELAAVSLDAGAERPSVVVEEG